MTEVAVPALHDFTLLRFVVDWDEKVAAFDLLGPDGPRAVIVSGLKEIELKRDDPWGPSSSVNRLHIALGNEAMLRVVFEMQSGDEIRLICASVR